MREMKFYRRMRNKPLRYTAAYARLLAERRWS